MNHFMFGASVATVVLAPGELPVEHSLVHARQNAIDERLKEMRTETPPGWYPCIALKSDLLRVNMVYLRI